MQKIKPKQLKKDRLLDQGVALLLEKGYHATGLKEILDTVQIPKGSFYNYFDLVWVFWVFRKITDG